MGNVFENNESLPASNEVDRLALEVSERTELSEHICRELLLNGWKFSQEIGKPDRWEKIY